MTSYAAYDAGLPCKNPSCKSHGRPHPNCHCYGNMAEGGEVSHFCSEDRMHEETCEHFAVGGSVPSHKHAGDSISSFFGDAGLHGLLKIHEGSDNSDADILKYNKHIKRGQKRLKDHVECLFEGGKIDHYDDEKAHERIDEWIKKGGVTQDLLDEHHNSHPTVMADGGAVDKPKSKLHNESLAGAYPEQNIMLQAAKGRMSNYLNSIRPQDNMPRLAFDDEMKDKQKEKDYKKALKMAANPLRILNKIQRGTIVPEDVKNLKNLHPEVGEALQQRLTEKIMKAQLEKKKPPLHIRQGLSLLLGVPLSGEVSPQNIQAAQAVFAPKQQMQGPQGQPVTKNKKNTSTLTDVNDSYETSIQSRIERQQKKN